MKPRMIGVGICLALGSCLPWAGAALDIKDIENKLDTTPDAAPAAAQNDAADLCFDHLQQGSSSPAEAGARRTVPDQPVFLSGAGSQAAYLLQADHDPSDWSGSLKKFSIAQDAAGQVIIGAPLWDAGRLLTSMSAAQRNIHTLRPNPAQAGVQSRATVPFTWAMLAPQQRAALDLAPDSGLADGLGERRLDFLRGDRSLEIGQAGGIFRRRASILGDAIHGAPLAVGAPSPGIVGAPYAAFFKRHARRPAAVYLGANDGMLHAFDAASGRELFAYVPNLVLPSLNQLSSVHYLHRPYLDGAIDAAEALVDGQWKTVLVAGLGAGARGVFALDISAPDQFGQGGGALWEFGSNDDAAIGHVVEAPLIAKFRIAAQAGAPGHRHFAMLAGGLDRAGQGGGTLFLLALDKPAAARWRLGVNYVKLTPAPAAGGGAGNGAALAPPALALDLDGAVRYAYAGDVQGNLWRFDFSGKEPLRTAAHAQLLFVARDAAGVRQPITQAPNVVFAPAGGFLVLFGTGKLNQGSDNDPANFKPQSFYAIHDAAKQVATVVQGRAALAARTPGGDAGSPGEARRGWYLDFPHAASTGERSVSRALLIGGKVVFNTVMPATTPCMVAGVRTYAVDALSGLADAGNSAGPGAAMAGPLSVHRMQLPALAGVLAMERSVGPREASGRALVRQRHAVLHVDTAGAVDTVSVISHPAPAKRVHWREIANWPELHRASKQ
jgi:type IV pilus assembly protein PilY1